MAHFAKIGLNSKVIDVVTVSDQELHDSNGVEREVIGVTFLTSASLPPTNIANSPDNAFFTPPETGASMRRIDFLTSCLPRSMVPLG